MAKAREGQRREERQASASGGLGWAAGLDLPPPSFPGGISLSLWNVSTVSESRLGVLHQSNPVLTGSPLTEGEGGGNWTKGHLLGGKACALSD